MFGSSGPQVGLLPSMTLKPACAAESRISSYSLARRGLLAAKWNRTSIGVVTPASVEQRLGALDVDLGVLGRAVLGDDARRTSARPATVVNESRSVASGFSGTIRRSTISWRGIVLRNA